MYFVLKTAANKLENLESTHLASHEGIHVGIR